MRLALAVMLVSYVSLLAAPTTQSAGFGPLYDRFPLTRSQGERTEILGPLISRQEEGTETTWAFSPLWSWRRDSATDFSEIDFLYPAITFDRFGLDYRLQFLQFFSFSGGHTMEAEGKRRLTLFPFYFQQRSQDPALNYTAVVPFYGNLKNRFFRDEISFVMLPAYLKTRKRDVVTENYLVPLLPPSAWGWPSGMAVLAGGWPRTQTTRHPDGRGRERRGHRGTREAVCALASLLSE